MANEYVLVSLELTMEDDSKLRTAAMKVPLYDETDAKAKDLFKYERCVRWPDLQDLAGALDADKHVKLRPWVDKYVTGVVFEKPLAELGLGPSARVGLTAFQLGTGTKTKEAFTDASIGQIPVSAIV